MMISYQIGCRNCLQSDGLEHHWMISGANERDYFAKTEFEVVKEIEAYRSEVGSECFSCGSSNTEVSGLSISGRRLYDFNSLAIKTKNASEYIFMLNIDKRNGVLETRPGGTSRIDKRFLESALLTITKTISERSPSDFQLHENGNFFICLSGKHDHLGASIKVESYRSAGIGKVEIYNEIRAFVDKVTA